MPISLRRRAPAWILAVAVTLPWAAHAHRVWLLPSATVLSESGQEA